MPSSERWRRQGVRGAGRGRAPPKTRIGGARHCARARRRGSEPGPCRACVPASRRAVRSRSSATRPQRRSPPTARASARIDPASGSFAIALWKESSSMANSGRNRNSTKSGGLRQGARPFLHERGEPRELRRDKVRPRPLQGLLLLPMCGIVRRTPRPTRRASRRR